MISSLSEWIFAVVFNERAMGNLFIPYANNKGAYQPAHPRSLISAFVVHYLDSTIHILPKSLSRR